MATLLWALGRLLGLRIEPVTLGSFDDCTGEWSAWRESMRAPREERWSWWSRIAGALALGEREEG